MVLTTSFPVVSVLLSGVRNDLFLSLFLEKSFSHPPYNTGEVSQFSDNEYHPPDISIWQMLYNDRKIRINNHYQNL